MGQCHQPQRQGVTVAGERDLDSPVRVIGLTDGQWACICHRLVLGVEVDLQRRAGNRSGRTKGEAVELPAVAVDEDLLRTNSGRRCQVHACDC